MYDFTIKWINGKFLQYLAALSVSILCATVGMSVSWSSPVLPQLYSDNSPIEQKLTETQGSWVVTFMLIGSVCGCIILAVAIDYIGRKGTLLMSAVPIFISWIMIKYAKSDIVLYVARFIQGFFLDVPAAVAFTYVGEIAEPSIRGRLAMYCMMLLEGGSIIVVIVGAYLSYEMLALISSLVPIIFFITFVFMPESPYYYVLRKNLTKAEDTLRLLRGNKVDIKPEMDEIITNIEENKSARCAYWALFRDKNSRKALLIVLGLKVLQQFSGTIAIQSYMKPIFEEAQTGFDSDIASIVCLIVPFPTMFLASYLIDSFGRKPLYYISTIGYAVVMILPVAYFYLKDAQVPYIQSLGLLPIAGVFLSFIFKCLGVSNLSYLLLSELFAPNVKGTAAAVGQISGSLLSAIVTLAFPPFSNAFGMGSSFVVFSASCFGGFLFIWYFLPETKGKSLNAIQVDIKETASVKEDNNVSTYL